MRQRKRAYAIWIGLFIVGLVVWLADIPIGYYQFKQRCKTEAGVKAFSALDRTQGWLVHSRSDAEFVTSTNRAPFGRYVDKNGSLIDVTYTGGNLRAESAYRTEPYRPSLATKYTYKMKNSSEDGVRLRSFSRELINTENKKIVLHEKTLIFTWTNPENTLLGQSGTASCPSGIELNEQFLKIYGGEVK